MKQQQTTEPGTHRDHCAICDRLETIPDTDDLCSTCRADIEMRCHEQAELTRMRRRKRKQVQVA